MPNQMRKAAPAGGPSKSESEMDNIAQLVGAQAAPRKPSNMQEPDDTTLTKWAAAHHRDCPLCSERYGADGEYVSAHPWQSDVHWISRGELVELSLASLRQQIRGVGELAVAERAVTPPDIFGVRFRPPRNLAWERAPYRRPPYAWPVPGADGFVTIARPVQVVVTPSGMHSVPAVVRVEMPDHRRAGSLDLANAGARAGFARLFPDWQVEVEDTLQLAYESILREHEREATSGIRLLDMDEAREHGRLEWLVEGVISDGALAQTFGPSGGGKTFAMLGLGLSFATGEPWLGREVQRRHVVYCLGEGVGGFQGRIEAWASAHDIPLDALRNWFFLLHEMPDFADPAVVDALLEKFEERELCPVIFVDTLAQALRGRDENSAVGMMPTLAGLQRLQSEAGATVILIHHSGHANEERARGWSGLYAALDVEIRVSPLLPSGALLESVIECTKSKDSAPFEPMTIQLRPVGSSLVPELVEGRTGGKPLSPKATAMLQLLADAGGEVVQTTALRTGLGGASRESVNRWGNELATRGLAEQVVDGKASGWKSCVIYDADVTHDADAANVAFASRASQPPLGGVTHDATHGGRDATDVEDEEPEDITALGADTSGDPGAPPSTRHIVTLDLRPPTGQRGPKKTVTTREGKEPPR